MPTSGMKPTPGYNAPLSRREVQLLSNWERQGQTFLTIDDLRREVGERAPRVASSLVRKHALARVRPGVYLLRSFRSLPHPSAASPVTTAAALLHDEPYYLGGLWALTHHRLTTQQQVSVIDAFVTRRHSATQLPTARLAFHTITPAGMQYGRTTTTFERVEVQVSDRERTLLDLLDHPTLVGSVQRGVSLFEEILSAGDPKRLVEYAVRGSRLSTCARLGVLLERAKVPNRALSPLRRKLRGSKSLLSMLPDSPRTGVVNPVWNVVENDQ
jgi:predicted transcriptional regulator of viral defense system